MGPMFDGINKLPKTHWIHKALAKEKARMEKKVAPVKVEIEVGAETEETGGED